MSTGQLDRQMKPTEVMERYGLKSRQSAYDRINALKSKNITVSGESLDKLDRHIKDGGTLADFAQVEVAPLPVEPAPITYPRNISGDSAEDNFIQLVREIGTALKPAADPLQHYCSLERAIASSWLLSTGEVKQLIGTKPTGDRYQRGSFVFIKAGRMGNQSAWRVMKVVKGDSYAK